MISYLPNSKHRQKWITNNSWTHGFAEKHTTDQSSCVACPYDCKPTPAYQGHFDYGSASMHREIQNNFQDFIMMIIMIPDMYLKPRSNWLDYNGN